MLKEYNLKKKFLNLVLLYVYILGPNMYIREVNMFLLLIIILTQSKLRIIIQIQQTCTFMNCTNVGELYNKSIRSASKSMVFAYNVY